MAKITRLSIACWSSLILTGCLHRATSLQMLEVRSDYDGKEQSEAASLNLADGPALGEAQGGGLPVRTTPRVAHIWIFPHETPSKEFFHGGWVSVVVEGDRWAIERPSNPLPDKPTIVVPEQSQKKKGG